MAPPVYPETADWTPFKRWKIASVHQKQPAAKVAVSVMVHFSIEFDSSGGLLW